jgi:hypothetical protein
VRCRSRHAQSWVEHADPTRSAIARGVVQHHADDDWFHQTAAFGDLSMTFAREIRRVTRDSDGMRPSFLGHILVELLLDAALHAEQPMLLDRYYHSLERVCSRTISDVVGTMIGANASSLAPIIDRFVELRFLYDYADDERLHFRLNQIMRRVNLAELPASFRAVLPDARVLVAAARENLLTPLATLA